MEPAANRLVQKMSPMRRKLRPRGKTMKDQKSAFPDGELRITIGGVPRIVKPRK